MMATWNWLDWVWVAIVIVSVGAAILKGFIGELIGLASLVAGLAIAAVEYRRAAPWFEDLTRSHEIALGVSFLLLFLGTLVVGALVAALARRLIKKAELEWFDRFMGGIFGLVRGVLINCVVLLVLLSFEIKPQAVRQSALAPYVTAGARVIALVMPSEMRSQFRSGFDKFREALARSDKTVKKEP